MGRVKHKVSEDVVLRVTESYKKHGVATKVVKETGYTEYMVRKILAGDFEIGEQKLNPKLEELCERIKKEKESQSSSDEEVERKTPPATPNKNVKSQFKIKTDKGYIIIGNVSRDQIYVPEKYEDIFEIENL